MTTPRHDRLSSATNANGMFEEFTSGKVSEQFPEEKQRLILAIADIQSFVTEVSGLDPDMAGVIAARSTQELLAALNTNLSQDEINKLIEMGSQFSMQLATSRAIHMITEDKSS